MTTYENIEDGVSQRRLTIQISCRSNNEQHSCQHRDFARPRGLPALSALYVLARAEPAALFPRLAAGLGGIHASFSSGRVVGGIGAPHPGFVPVVIAVGGNGAGDSCLNSTDTTAYNFREA